MQGLRAVADVVMPKLWIRMWRSTRGEGFYSSVNGLECSMSWSEGMAVSFLSRTPECPFGPIVSRKIRRVRRFA